MKVLISGASVAGPALAFLLHRDGHEVTVVERAPALRDSGYAVDFRGAAFDALADLGILEEVRGYATGMRGTDLLDADGNRAGELPAEVFAGELEVPKRELTRILYEHTRDAVRYVFDDSINAVEQDADSVRVGFERAAPDTFDLVVGADGIYSAVRRLVFGPHSEVIRHLGLSGAGFSAPNHLGLDHRGALRQTPGRAVYLFSAADPERMSVSLSFASDSPKLDLLDRAEQERIVRERMAGAGWIVPRLLEDMSAAEDLYFSSACQVHLDHWSEGRVVLVGDAGYCAAPTSGMGTSQALIGARVLARHLAESGGDHTKAFAAYEQELRPYVAENQETGREGARRFGAG
ncbi:2-polyprenyl-6-methoxyphenol hydroxylase-like FAD-dependent oxidoreductase [Streptomyces puniciscabiei]|uniref:2-polyprenyl-6-methoxyphenol hydroxylase-like FAD-dependent oxidoreductase n=1 Tax=Streptomyces puniciscabiei TaxID=164348 RepID=A0A542UKF8_9ACTN|nr:FAD-dependent monooxygenase [Streptomyces puniciscabiei]TQK99558.1 2-polyprenyl-6-methoxyphenol hydroxylase-like FAD-dependent oxidoreductase [Streptomyces puniciscabiei]